MKRVTKTFTLAALIAVFSQPVFAGCYEKSSDIDDTLHNEVQSLMLASQNQVSSKIKSELNESIWLQSASLLDDRSVAPRVLIADTKNGQTK